jgi:hypothetical protein
MVDLGFLGSVAILLVAAALNAIVLAYRWPRSASVRRWIDRCQARLTGRPDWSWLRLSTLMVPLVALTIVNVVWQVGTLHCADDSLAIFASGQAALHGQNPFQVSYCNEPFLENIPYGLAAVSLNALGALAGSVAGIWIVWQLVALAVVPLVWEVAGPDRRYLSVLAATSVLYLPNIATNIGVDNAVVPVSVLLMLYALQRADRSSVGWKALAAFLSTARFPALFPLLGSSGATRERLRQFLGVVAIFLAAALLSYALWGWDAISIVYLGQFSRLSGGTLNFFAVLLEQGWLLPSLVSAAIQGGAVVALALYVALRRYSARAAVALPLLGVMLLSQYLNFHFVVWIVPLVLLGYETNVWLYVYGIGAAFDETVTERYFGMTLGLWGPYEVMGVLLSLVLLYVLYLVIRDEEARLRTEQQRPGSPPMPTPGPSFGM